ncbi:MAG: hypothetical protein V1703_01660 [Candidatus Altiarchaeota archaeon]
MDLKDYISVEKVNIEYKTEADRIRREYDESLSRITNVIIPIVVAAMLVVLGLYYAKDHISILSKFGLTAVFILFIIIVDSFILYSSWKIDIAKNSAEEAMKNLKENTFKKLEEIQAASGEKKK